MNKIFKSDKEFINHLKEPGHYALAIKLVEKREYAEDILNGKFYMNKIKYFNEVNTSHIGDPYDSKYLIPKGNGELLAENSGYEEKRVCCFFGLDTRNLEPVEVKDDSLIYKYKFSDIEKELLKKHFKSNGYEWAVVIEDSEKFVELLQKCGPLEFRYVDYEDRSQIDDSTKSDDFNPVFRKIAEEFSVQREYRLLKRNDEDLDGNFFDINYKDMHEICKIIPIDDLLEVEFHRTIPKVYL